MKTWITYLVATLMGLATTLLLGQFAAYETFIRVLSSYIIQFGGFVLFPVIFFTFAAGIASLRKDQLGGRLASVTIVWTILSSLILSALGLLIIFILPVVFPASSSAGAGTAGVINYLETAKNVVKDAILPINPFFTLASSQNFLLPLIIIAFFLGYFLKPDSEIIRPAYVTINSFSEVMYRISSTFTIFGFCFVYFISASFFMSLQKDASIFVAPRFLFSIIVLSLVAILIVLPFIYGIVTGFKRNPYSVLFRTLAVSLSALFSGNIFFAAPIALSLNRKNLGVQKRASSTAFSLSMIFSRGGSAMIASFTIGTLLYATTGTLPTLNLSIFIIICSSLTSLFCSTFLGYEVFFIVYFTLKLIGINLQNAEMSIVGLLPLLNGLGTMIDTIIGNLCTNSCSNWIECDTKIPYDDML